MSAMSERWYQRERRSIPELWWRSKGFAEFPRLAQAQGKEILYRVFDRMDDFGKGSGRFGAFYSLIKPTSVSDAEFNLNVVKWGNRCFHFASFKVGKGTPMYIGKIDQSYLRERGETETIVWGNPNAEQVWIDPTTAMAVLKLLGTQPLRQDYHVVFPRTRTWS